MVSFRGQNLLKPRPDWSPLGVKFKISDKHPRLFRMGVPPPPTGPILVCLQKNSSDFRTIWETKRNFLSRTDVFLKSSKSTLNLARFDTKFVAVRKNFCSRPCGKKVWEVRFNSSLCILRFHCPCRRSTS